MPQVSYTSVVQEFIEGLRAVNNGAQFAVVLIGSVARSTHTSESDLDLLVISDGLVKIDRRPDRLHVQSLTVEDFSSRLATGDDFAAWAVRYGIPVINSPAWSKLVSSPEARVWPDWRSKIAHAARRLTLAAALLDTGDVPAAAEEILYAVSHTGRAILLQGGVFPLSRPEMINQLREFGKRELASLLQAFSYEIPNRSALTRAIRYIKRLLVTLDRSEYRNYVHSRRKRLAAKASRTSQFRAVKTR